MSTVANNRTCAQCGVSLQRKRSDARYCTRHCKVQASDRRRADGRSTARDRARYHDEAEHRREYARRYLRERPGKATELKLLRKSRLRDVPTYRFTERDWRRLKARFRGCCAYCGLAAELQREHVVPLCRGGSHGVGNILPACARCNYGKRASLLIEWKLRLRGEGVMPT